MIVFGITGSSRKHDVQLVYRCQECSFDTSGPSQIECRACITINEVQLVCDDSRRVLCVIGYCPYHEWQKTPLSPPSHAPGDLVVLSDLPFTPGVAIGLSDPNRRWPVYVNSGTWVCIGDPADEGDRAVEFSLDSVAVLRGDHLVALWLHPVILRSD